MPAGLPKRGRCGQGRCASRGVRAAPRQIFGRRVVARKCLDEIEVGRAAGVGRLCSQGLRRAG
eukprot:4163606-Lingulodinium_polyedra.AAC.1